MGILQWTFRWVALLVHCFWVKFDLGRLVFVDGGKLRDLEKNLPSMDKNQKQTQCICDARFGNQMLAIVVGGKKLSPLCQFPAPIKVLKTHLYSNPARISTDLLHSKDVDMFSNLSNHIKKLNHSLPRSLYKFY